MISLNTGDTITILLFKICYKWYRGYSNGKLLCDCIEDFTDYLFYKYFCINYSATIPQQIDVES